MKPGKIKLLIGFFLIFIFNFNISVNSEEKINSVPLINLEDLKPSYEEMEEDEKLNTVDQDYQL